MKQNYIKIPLKCIIPLVGDKTLLRAFCIWGKLKTNFSYASIHNIKSRKLELAQDLGISENTFRKYLGVLKSNGLVRFDSDGSLRLVNKYFFLDLFKSEYKKKEKVIFRKLSLNDLSEDNIKLIALELKKEQINFKNLQRLKSIKLKEFGAIQCGKIRSKIKKKVAIESATLLSNLKKSPAKSFLNIGKYGFVDDNMCAESIAKMFGKKSKVSALNFLHKMKGEKKISLRKRFIKLEGLTYNTDIKMYRKAGHNGLFIKRTKKRIFLALNLPLSWSIEPK